MVEHARTSRMTLTDFLRWDDGTGRHYELVDGQPVAMTPPKEAHGTVTINLGAALKARLKPPCRVQGEAGILPPNREDSWYQADLAVTCAPPAPDRQWVENPILIVEVGSDSTAAQDRGEKAPDYREIPTLRHLLLVSTRKRRVEHWMRDGGEWIGQHLIGDAVIALPGLDTSLPMSEIYEGSGL